MKTVATIGHRFPDASIEVEVLHALGIDAVSLGGLSKEAAVEAARDADAVLLGLRFALDAGALERLKCCRAVVRYGVGVDNIDLAAAARLGITVCNVPDYCVEEVANHAISLLLLFARRLDLWAADVRAGRWGSAISSVRLPRLSATTIGVVGAGRIGRAVIARAVPIWGRVLVCDPAVDAGEVGRLGGESVTLDALLAHSDFVTLHVPSAAGTRAMLSDRELRLMKPGAILVNCSRGDLIDETALARAIADGRIGGAGLDVFANEPPSGGLIALPQVWPTPHVAWLSEVSIADLRRRAAEEAARVLRGERPRYVVATPSS